MQDLVTFIIPYLKSKIGWVVCLSLVACLFRPGLMIRSVIQGLDKTPTHRILFWSIVITTLLRLTWMNESSHVTYFERIPDHLQESDMINVHAIEVSQGIGVINPDGTPSGWRPVGYIYFLAFFYWILGIKIWIPFLLQLFLYWVILWLIYRICNHLGQRWVTNLVVLLCGIYPTSIFSSKIVLDEYLFIPLWLWGIDIFLGALPNLSWSKVVQVGILWGFSSITRTHSIIMPVVVACVGTMSSKQKFQWISKSLVMMMVLLAVNIPWAIRNYNAWGKFVYYTADGGPLYSCLNPMATAKNVQLPAKGTPYYSKEFHLAKNEGERSQIGYKMAVQWVSENPKSFLTLGVQKALWFMSPENHVDWTITMNFGTPENHDIHRELPSGLMAALVTLLRVTYALLFYSFCFLVVASLLIRKARAAWTEPFLFLFCTIVFWIGLHTIIFAQSKYRFPIEPLMTICSVYLFHFVAGSLSSERYRKIAG